MIKLGSGLTREAQVKFALTTMRLLDVTASEMHNIFARKYPKMTFDKIDSIINDAWHLLLKSRRLNSDKN